MTIIKKTCTGTYYSFRKKLHTSTTFLCSSKAEGDERIKLLMFKPELDYYTFKWIFLTIS